MNRRRLVVIVLVIALGAVALVIWWSPRPAGDPAPTGPTATGPTATPTRTPEPTAEPEEELTGELVVLAASSLAEPFTELAADFEVANPRVTVTVGLGPSSGLAAQVIAGAPADVLATANEATMADALEGLQDLEVEGAASARPVLFARNTMALAVPAPNPAGITGIGDLAREDVSFAVCAVRVPCGAAAGRVLSAAGIVRLPVTYEQDAAAVMTKVGLGEVDAGIVYASDVRPEAPAVVDGLVTGIALPPEWNTTTSYPILTVPGAHNPDAAEAFVDLVLSPRGTRALQAAGFLAP